MLRKDTQHYSSDASESDHVLEEARDAWKGSGAITSVDVKCSLLFFLVCAFSGFSMNMYLTLSAVRITQHNCKTLFSKTYQ